MLILIKVLPWLMLLLLVAAWTPWRSIFEKLWGNNPKRAKVYVEYGEQIALCKGKFLSDCKKGQRYRYKCYGEWCVVIVPSKYPYKYIFGGRQIRVIAGQGTAAPLGGMPDSSVAVSSATLDAIFRADIGTQLAKTIFGKAVNLMMVLIIVVGVVVLGYFIYKQMSTGGLPGLSPQPGIEQPVQPQPQQPSIVPQPGPLE